MKLQHAVVSTLVGVSLLGVGRMAGAQPAGGPKGSMDLDIRTAQPLSDVQKQAVKQFVTDWVAVLQDESDAKRQAQARDTLSTSAGGVGNRNPSVDYLDFYAATVADALKPVIANQNVRARLLGAIVAKRVAERVNNTRLQEVALALLQDKSDAVALWGMGAARYIVPQILRNPMEDTELVKAIVPAVESHPGAPMVRDAYESFSVPPTAGAQAIGRGLNRTLELINLRVKQYVRGLPDDPDADSIGTTFMTTPQIWAALTPEQRVNAVQGISNLIGVMAQRVTVSDDPQTSLRRIGPSLTNVARALQAIANYEKVPALATAVQPLTALRLTATPQDVAAAGQAVYPAVKAVPAFQSVQPPPAIAGGTAGGGGAAPGAVPAGAGAGTSATPGAAGGAGATATPAAPTAAGGGK